METKHVLSGEYKYYLFPVEESLTNSLLVMGMTFCMKTCWSSLSPNGPEGNISPLLKNTGLSVVFLNL